MPELTERLKQIGLTAVAFETVEENGRLPLLAPVIVTVGRPASSAIPPSPGTTAPGIIGDFRRMAPHPFPLPASGARGGIYRVPPRLPRAGGAPPQWGVYNPSLLHI